MNTKAIPLRRIFTIILLGSLAFTLTFCASSSELEEEEVEELLNRASGQIPMSVYVDIDRFTSRLSDNYAMLYNPIPEAFQNVNAVEERRSGNRGFRVQIISTRDLSEAESVEAEFLTWMREEDISPRHESYIRFRQPYYRLHLGNFLSRAEAIEFSRVVREDYPNAWVVPDEIDPEAIERFKEAEEADDNEIEELEEPSEVEVLDEEN
ncbi:MAG: SPOR domain-containing protein [Balneolales bacterium]